MPHFVAPYPEITLDVVLSDGVADFVEEGLDLAIRVGRVGSENLVARHIGETALLIAASHDYLARMGNPGHPEDLLRHACFTYTYSATGNQWQFEDEAGQSVSVRIGGPVNANNGMLLAEMAAAGSGIVLAPCFILQPLIAAGRLVQVLPEWKQRRLPFDPCRVPDPPPSVGQGPGDDRLPEQLVRRTAATHLLTATTAWWIIGLFRFSTRSVC